MVNFDYVTKEKKNTIKISLKFLMALDQKKKMVYLI